MMTSKFWMLILMFGCGATYAGEDRPSYPKPELLIEPARLATPEISRSFIILDARERTKFEQGHLSGARWVDHAAWAKAFGDGTDADGWSRRIGELGITGDARIIIYDDNMTKDAARIWWILRYWGVENVRLVNGGWNGWKAGKFPTESIAAPFTATQYQATPHVARFANKEQMLKAIAGNVQIVDARSEGEYCGTEKMTNKRAGAMPGAKQLEWIDLIDKETQRFKSPAELRRLFAAAGIDLKNRTVTHCQSGGRASVMAFALELMGAEDVGNYYASWSEWGNADDTPVVPGTPKKKP
jgi:thiosulfate/3-mercaptopyruvate sulfurtransferase